MAENNKKRSFFGNLFGGADLQAAAKDRDEDVKAGSKVTKTPLPPKTAKKSSPAQRLTEAKARARNLKRTGGKQIYIGRRESKR